MTIDKIINNNIVISYKNGQEAILMGKGIGFSRKPGDLISDAEIEKIYLLENESVIGKLVKLLENMKIEYIRVSNEIIDYAETVIGAKLNSSIYISLTDHVNFAIERHYKNQILKNNLYSEIKRFYPIEFKIGEIALQIIKNSLNIQLDKNEAAFIALHILNAELNHKDLSQTGQVASIVNTVYKMVTDCLRINPDEDSIEYERFITHLKFFSSRVIDSQHFHDEDEDFVAYIISQYPQEHECALEIKNYIKNEYSREVTNAELMYLIIHIRRIRTM